MQLASVTLDMPTDNEAERQVTLRYLEDAVRALAQPASVQRELFAENPMAGDEMATDFDAWYVPALQDDFLDRWSPEQREALNQVEVLLSEMTTLQDLELWTAEALESNAWWGRMREVASTALTALGWGHEPPTSLLKKVIVTGRQD